MMERRHFKNTLSPADFIIAYLQNHRKHFRQVNHSHKGYVQGHLQQMLFLAKQSEDDP
jgi:hypothetical protein